MTIATESCINTHSGTGTTGPFAYAFRAYDTSDIEVVRTDSAGTPTTLAQTVDYTVTVSPAGIDSGGTITTVAAVATGQTLTIRRKMAYKQESDLSGAGFIPPETLEDLYDRAVMLVQQVKELADRALAGTTSSGGVTATWGTISGTLSAQTDLDSSLGGKLGLTGGTLTGTLITNGALLLPSSSSVTPSNREVWLDSTGMYARVNGATVGPFVASSAGQWGGITGTFSSQADLQAALALKADASNVGSIGTQSASNVAITGGVINGTQIGITSPQAGVFTRMVNNAEYNNGNSGSSKMITWDNGQNQRVDMTANCTFTFTPPSNGIGVFRMKLVQGGTGSYTATWPASVMWPGDVAPTLSSAVNARDIITWYYDGFLYHQQSVVLDTR